MAQEKVTVLAIFKAKAGMEETVRDAIKSLIAPTRIELGCINYDLHQSSDDPSLFMLYENWISKKDLDTHLSMPHLKNFLEKADDMLEKPVDIKLWQMIGEPA